MLEIILLSVAIVGTLIAGIIDLKTTEIPDEIPYIMAGVGLIGNLAKSIIIGNFNPLFLSFLFGFSFLIFGFLLYFTGQWGGGDAKILSSVGFLLPELSINKSFFPFPLSFFFNVFFIGAIYMILYMLIISILNGEIFKKFLDDFKNNTKEFLIFFLVGLIFSIIFFLFWSKYFNLRIKDSIFLALLIFLSSLFFYLVWKFAKFVEEFGFKRKIKVSNLKEGDVLEGSKIWEGLKKEEVNKIKKSGKKYVVIKEGVRFAPVFFISLIFTLILGDFIFLIIKLI